MESIFIYKDSNEGKIGIGKLPDDLLENLEKIEKEFYKIVPDKSATVYHKWYKDFPENIKVLTDKIKDSNFWKKLCDNTNNCIILSNEEMNELYYSKPKGNMKDNNFYGSSGNYVIHKDGPFSYFNSGIRFYRVLIGLTTDNNNVITNFVNADIEHKINRGDYVVFDFDRTTHQVKKSQDDDKERILLKLHFIVCEDCEFPPMYIELWKKIYLLYEIITRFFMENGKDPETFLGFFFGLISSSLYLQNLVLYIIIFLVIIVIILNKIFKIKFKYKNVLKFIKYIFLGFVFIYLLFTLFFWLRYKLFNIK